MSRRVSPLGVQVARLVVRGDVHAARLLAGGRTSWTVPEARAISGALRAARARFGVRLSLGGLTGGAS